MMMKIITNAYVLINKNNITKRKSSHKFLFEKQIQSCFYFITAFVNINPAVLNYACRTAEQKVFD